MIFQIIIFFYRESIFEVLFFPRFVYDIPNYKNLGRIKFWGVVFSLLCSHFLIILLCCCCLSWLMLSSPSSLSSSSPSYRHHHRHHHLLCIAVNPWQPQTQQKTLGYHEIWQRCWVIWLNQAVHLLLMKKP